MKLNNRGWGLGFLIVIGVLFLVILIFVSIKIRAMTHQIKDEENDDSKYSEPASIDRGIYTTLEGQLQKAGESYTVFHTTLIENTNDHIIVWFNTLKEEGFIESLEDPESDNDCKGYVMIKNNGDVNSFIKCAKYSTINYELWVDDNEE